MSAEADLQEWLQDYGRLSGDAASRQAKRFMNQHARELAEKIRGRCHKLYGSPTALRPGLWADEGYGLLDAADLIDPEVRDGG